MRGLVPDKRFHVDEKEAQGHLETHVGLDFHLPLQILGHVIAAMRSIWERIALGSRWLKNASKLCETQRVITVIVPWLRLSPANTRGGCAWCSGLIQFATKKSMTSGFPDGTLSPRLQDLDGKKL